MRDLQELYDAVDLAIGSGKDVLPEDRLAEAAAAIRDVRNRRGHLGETLVVAIVGGTGSGKSSLLNAIAGRPVASTSRIRPHTDRPLALLPEDAEGGVGRLLDDLGVAVDDRHRHDRLPGVALIDLPDMDSTAAAHRKTVEALVPRVDAVLWVLDPEKYRDPELHRAFLAPLVRYADQTVFVLNKIDRLDEAGPPETGEPETGEPETGEPETGEPETGEPETGRHSALAAVIADVVASLEAHGYDAPRVFATAADPDGPPRGVDALVGFLDDELDAKQVAQGKLLADVAALIRGLGIDAGVWGGASVRFDERWARARTAAVAALVPGAPAPSEDALCRLEDLVAAIATEVDPATATRIRRLGGSEDISEAATAALAAVSTGDPAAAAAGLDRSLGRPIAELLDRRARFAGVLAYAAVGARELANRRRMMSW